MNKKRKLMIYTVLLYLLVITIFPNVSADSVRIEGGFIPTYFVSCSCTNYTCLQQIDNITVRDGAIYLNNYLFQVTPSSGRACVTINSWNPPNVVFTVCTMSETTMRLGGFTAYATYTVKVDGICLANYRANATGILSFTYGSWSPHTFTIEEYTHGYAGGKSSGRNWVNVTPLDSDDDGLTDNFETLIGTDPTLPDSDFDGFTDFEEFIQDTDPLDYFDNPERKNILIPIAIGIAILLVIIVIFVLRRQ